MEKIRKIQRYVENVEKGFLWGIFVYASSTIAVYSRARKEPLILDASYVPADIMWIMSW